MLLKKCSDTITRCLEVSLVLFMAGLEIGQAQVMGCKPCVQGGIEGVEAGTVGQSRFSRLNLR